MAIQKYGKTVSEKRAEDTFKCRQIVAEIMNHGVSQSQILRLIYLLSLELEDRERLQKLSDLAKSFEEDDSQSDGLIV